MPAATVDPCSIAAKHPLCVQTLGTSCPNTGAAPSAQTTAPKSTAPFLPAFSRARAPCSLEAQAGLCLHMQQSVLQLLTPAAPQFSPCTGQTDGCFLHQSK